MATIENTQEHVPVSWSVYKKIAFRIAFIFFVLVSIPLSGSWYKNLVSIDWSRPHYRDIYDIARYGTNVPSLFGGSGKTTRSDDAEAAPATSKKASKDKVSTKSIDSQQDSQAAELQQLARKRTWYGDYASWGNALVLAVIGGLVWTLIDRKRPSYNVLYYWLTVIVRFRAAIGIIGFGYTKLFPTQMPFPSLGLLNTDFGDFTAQKIYWLSVGIVPWYQVFGGVVELLAGALLFFRKTATFGAILLIGALGDITFVNYAYDGGVHVYAFYFVLLGSFVIAADVPRLYNLLILERYTVPHFYYPDYTKPAYKYGRIALKSLAIIIFFGVLTYTEVINFKYDPYKQPATAGLKTLRGNYTVTQFKINGQEIPYSPLDSVRWKEATFEKWTTLTFRVNKPVVVDPSNGGGSPMRDVQRTFEIAGTAGGQRAFHYYADTVDKVLYLQDKNAVAARAPRESNGDATDRQRSNKDNWITDAAWKNIADENKFIHPAAWSTRRDREFARPEKNVNRAKMVLSYRTTDGSRVILTGLNENRDSIYVVLDKRDRKYILPESSLNAGKY